MRAPLPRDWSWWYPSGNDYGNIWASLPALVMVSSSIRLTAWLQIQRSGRNGQEIDVWAESPRLSPLWLSASSSACHGLLIITVINAITYKAQRDKNARELKLANAAITDMQMRQRDAAALDAKYTEELADAAGAWLPARRCCRWSSSAAHQSVCQSCVKPPPPPAWIMQLPDWQTPLNGIISPSGERLITMQKQLEGTQYINEQIELPISMGNSCNYCEHTRASSGV